MIKISPILLLVLFSLTLTFGFVASQKIDKEFIKNEFKTSHVKIRSQKYIACKNLPHVIPMVNNNSVSTAISSKDSLFLAVTGKVTQIYKFPINITKIQQNRINQSDSSQEQEDSAEPFQNLKEATFSSAVSYTQDGSYLAVGSSSANTHIYAFDGNQYVLRQTLKNSYYSNGGRVLLSIKGQYLFTTESNKQINVYVKGQNLYQLLQTIPINLQAFTIYSLTHDFQYFAVVQQNTSTLLLSVFAFSRQQNKYVRFGKSKPISQLISDVSMNNDYIVVAIGTLRVNCSTMIYKINKQKQSIDQVQQIFQPTGSYCIISSFITSNNKLILTNIYTTSFVYKLDSKTNSFINDYQIYHEAQGAPIHTQVRLLDTKYQHLLVYTGVQINMYCPMQETEKFYELQS